MESIKESRPLVIGRGIHELWFMIAGGEANVINQISGVLNGHPVVAHDIPKSLPSR